MTRALRAVTAALLLVGLFGSAAWAQSLDDGLQVVTSDLVDDEVILTVQVDRALRDRLDSDGFVVRVGRELVTPTVTAIEGDELEVVLAVDTSGSMTEEAFAAAKDSALTFVRAMPEGARVAIVGFGDEAAVVQPFTSDPEAAIAALETLSVQGNTALYSAVIEAARLFAPNSTAVKTIVVLSDGGNTVEDATLGRALAAVQGSGAVLQAVSIETEESDPDALATLATGSAGAVASVGDVSLLTTEYANLAIDLRNQFRLRFAPETGGTVDAAVQNWADGVLVAERTVRLTLPRRVGPATAPTDDVSQPQELPVQRAVATPPAERSNEVASQEVLKWGAVASLGLALAAGAMLLMSPSRERPTRGTARDQFDYDGGAQDLLGRVTGWITGRTDRALAAAGDPFGLSTLLDTAGWKFRVGEFVLLVGLIAAVCFFGGGLVSIPFGIVLTVLWLGLVGGGLYLLAHRRRVAFAEQLNATFMSMAGSLRAGYSLPQVVALVAQEAAAPTGDEFSRIVVETRLGRDLVESADDVADRMRSEDFRWAVSAIDISRDLGGDLAEVLDNVAATIRSRDQVRRQVQALSAEGRISAVILAVLPFPIFLWQFMRNRDYTMLLFETQMGRGILMFGVVALVIGIFWMRRLIEVEY